MMESRVEQAAARHRKGYNCAQAVACTYCDRFGVDEDTAFRMTEGFGLGMGGMQGTCGAVTGAIVLAGLKNSRGMEDTTTKASTYKIAREIVKRFEEKNGASVCRVLKGVDTGKVIRACPDCIRDAAEIAEELLF